MQSGSQMISSHQNLFCCQTVDLGLVDYELGCQYQKQAVETVLAGEAQKIITCEHPAVLTMGRLTDPHNLLVSSEELQRMRIKCVSVDRGGDITLHCPGQMVVYPILNLSFYGRDLHVYLRKLEHVIIDFLKGFDILANRFPGQTGVWVGEKKIASIGIGVRKWISFHGLSINVNTDLRMFSLIRPCGLNVAMTSMAEIKRKTLDMNIVRKAFTKVFMNAFSLSLVEEKNEPCHSA